MTGRRIGAVLALVLVWVGFPVLAYAKAGINIDLGVAERDQVGAALKMIVVLTSITLAPAILLTMTSFVRIAVVFSFLRSALGLQGMPPQQVLMGLSLFLTIAIMAPTANVLYATGLQPYLDGDLSLQEAATAGAIPLRAFMLKQTRQTDLALFVEISATELPATPDELGMHLLVPAFVISELRTAFEMGFLLFVPFLVLDLIVASVLMSMGMVMLPPALISLPIKVLLFVMADGWNLIVQSLVRSFG